MGAFIAIWILTLVGLFVLLLLYNPASSKSKDHKRAKPNDIAIDDSSSSHTIKEDTFTDPSWKGMGYNIFN